MQDQAMIALSATSLGIALAGILSSANGEGSGAGRIQLRALFVLFAAITSLPLVIAFAPNLYVLILPVMLPALFALPPVMYRYADAHMPETEEVQVRRYDWALPAAGLAVALGYWLLPTSFQTAMLVEGKLPPGIATSVLALFAFVLILIWPFVSLGYLVSTLRRLHGIRVRFKNQYSNTRPRDLHWIGGLMACWILVWIAAGVSVLATNLSFRAPLFGEHILAIICVLLLLLIVFASISASVSDHDELPVAEAEAKYARSALSQDRARQLAHRLARAMQNDELYLDPNLSLKRLSRHVGALPNLVSQTLNEEIGMTFFDYVARWRIEVAKPMVLAGEMSVAEIALAVGFNSRSTFYKSFKKQTSMAPKEYRKSNPLQGAEFYVERTSLDCL